MKKERTDTPRFYVGELVRITTAIMSRRALQVGTVVSMRTSSQARTLDKYVVGFSDSSLQTFWDIQLEAAQPPEAVPSQEAGNTVDVVSRESP